MHKFSRRKISWTLLVLMSCVLPLSAQRKVNVITQRGASEQ
jgi:hypothetical protein